MSHPFARTACIHYDVVTILWQGLYVRIFQHIFPCIQASGGLLLPTFLGRTSVVGRLPGATGMHLVDLETSFYAI
jgi:hypothetical protein